MACRESFQIIAIRHYYSSLSDDSFAAGSKVLNALFTNTNLNLTDYDSLDLLN